jgi:ATP-binding cassette subfamily B protein
LFLDFLAFCLSKNIGLLFSKDLKVKMLKKLFKFELCFLHKIGTGKILDTINSDTDLMSDFFGVIICDLLGSTLLLLGVITVMFLESLILGTAFLLSATLIFFILLQFGKNSEKFWLKAKNLNSKVFGRICEFLSAREEMIGLKACNYITKTFKNDLKLVEKTIPKTEFFAALPSNLSMLTFSLIDALGLGLGSFLYLSRNEDIGIVYMIFNYVGLMYKPMFQIKEEFLKAGSIVSSLKRCIIFLNEKAENESENLLCNEIKNIEFKNINFSYSNQKKILKNVNFFVKKGECIGIIGRTGSGKTTLINLMLGLLRSHGVKINGIDMSNYNIDSVRKRCFLISQETEIFSGTLQENITLFDNRISREIILKAINDLNLFDILKSSGCELELSLDNKRPSSGVLQLVGFLRAKIANPELLIMDEPSSFIKTNDIFDCQEIIKNLSKDKITIIVEHNLTTIKNVDKIFKISNGILAQYKTIEEALEREMCDC